MGKRQQAYRERRLAQGWERIELLVPAEAAPWLRAYAGALRSAADLGLPMPRFDGMGASSLSTPAQHQTQLLIQAASGHVSNRSPNTQLDQGRQPMPPVTPTTRDDETKHFLDRTNARRSAKKADDIDKVDFSSGLIRNAY